ncbi:MAG: hypothetical protein VW802_13710 [Rhodospirillaceae bacterium]|jgi:hypothetical protein
MKNKKMNKNYLSAGVAAVLGGAMMFASPVAADSLPINYDDLSFVEEPLALDVGVGTLSFSALADQAVTHEFNGNETTTYDTVAKAQFNFETELPNSMTLAMQYVGTFTRLADDEITETYALSIADSWGTIAVGEVAGLVKERTRRGRGVGNASLANDDFLGGLEAESAFYGVRVNSFQASLAVDRDGQGAIGLSFEQPVSQGSVFTAVRLQKGDTNDGTTSGGKGDSYGGVIVGGYSYGSFSIDGQIGYERIDLEASGNDNNNTFASVGAKYKYGVYSVSLDLGGGVTDGDTRHAASLGFRADMFRGASFNAGLNHSNAFGSRSTKVKGSIRYEF